jgi:hypothetical protein
MPPARERQVGIGGQLGCRRCRLGLVNASTATVCSVNSSFYVRECVSYVRQTTGT